MDMPLRVLGNKKPLLACSQHVLSGSWSSVAAVNLGPSYYVGTSKRTRLLLRGTATILSEYYVRKHRLPSLSDGSTISNGLGWLGWWGADDVVISGLEPRNKSRASKP